MDLRRLHLYNSELPVHRSEAQMLGAGDFHEDGLPPLPEAGLPSWIIGRDGGDGNALLPFFGSKTPRLAPPKLGLLRPGLLQFREMCPSSPH